MVFIAEIFVTWYDETDHNWWVRENRMKPIYWSCELLPSFPSHCSWTYSREP